MGLGVVGRVWREDVVREGRFGEASARKVWRQAVRTVMERSMSSDGEHGEDWLSMRGWYGRDRLG